MNAFTRHEMPRGELEQLRDALAVVKRTHPHVTLRLCIRRGLALVLRELEVHHNRGEHFPERDGPVPKTRFTKKTSGGAAGTNAAANDDQPPHAIG